MKKLRLLLAAIAAALTLSACDIEISFDLPESLHEPERVSYTIRELSDIPDYSGNDTIYLNNNEPYFEQSELTTNGFEYYSDLDRLGRCGSAYACLCRELMPTKKRGNISYIKPTGWHSSHYDFVEGGGSLYNRSHLIGHQLSGEDANERNLITGTRYMNATLMLPFENMVADYIKETDNHVMYRVTPYFKDNELVARGVQMEAYSVEDEGDGVCYNVFCYNVQPRIEIDYDTGDNRESGSLK